MTAVGGDSGMGDVSFDKGHFDFQYDGAVHSLKKGLHGFSTQSTVAEFFLNGEMFHIDKVFEIPISNQSDRGIEVSYQQAMKLVVSVRIGTLLLVIPPFVGRKGGMKQFLYEEVEGVFGGNGL